MNMIHNYSLLVAMLLAGNSLSYAAETDQDRRIAELEARVAKLEKLYEEKNSEFRWKDPILWSRITRGMTEDDIRKLLGKPTRVEVAIFTTWYYHPTSKLHSHVWFDEGEVLGWEGLPPEHKPRPKLLK